MDLHHDESMSVGWVVTRVDGENLAAGFCLKATYQLAHGESARQLDQPTLVCGDLYGAEDPSKSLCYA